MLVVPTAYVSTDPHASSSDKSGRTAFRRSPLYGFRRSRHGVTMYLKNGSREAASSDAAITYADNTASASHTNPAAASTFDRRDCAHRVPCTTGIRASASCRSEHYSPSLMN
jgi:hypothetical protein